MSLAVGFVLINFAKNFPDNPSRVIYTEIKEKSVIYTGKDKPELMTQINKGLDEMMANGTYQKIYEKWFDNRANEVMLDKDKIK